MDVRMFSFPESKVNVCVGKGVYPFPPPAGCKREGVFISTVRMYCVSLSTARGGCEIVYLSLVNNVNMRVYPFAFHHQQFGRVVVSLSAAHSVDLLQCRHARCIPFPFLLYGHAGFIHLHHHQCVLAGYIHLCHKQCVRAMCRVYLCPLSAKQTCKVYPTPPLYIVFKCWNAGLYVIRSVRYRNE
jgi:hypothetical protein